MKEEGYLRSLARSVELGIALKRSGENGFTLASAGASMNFWTAPLGETTTMANIAAAVLRLWIPWAGSHPSSTICIFSSRSRALNNERTRLVGNAVDDGSMAGDLKALCRRLRLGGLEGGKEGEGKRIAPYSEYSPRMTSTAYRACVATALVATQL